MNKEQAAKAKASWMVQCLGFGYEKSELDGLSEIWDKHKDEYGNLRPSPSPQEAVGVTPELITRATKYWDKFRKLPIGNAEMIMHLATFTAAMREYAAIAPKGNQDELWQEFRKDVALSGRDSNICDLGMETVQSKYLIIKKLER